MRARRPSQKLIPSPTLNARVAWIVGVLDTVVNSDTNIRSANPQGVFLSVLLEEIKSNSSGSGE